MEISRDQQKSRHMLCFHRTQRSWLSSSPSMRIRTRCSIPTKAQWQFSAMSNCAEREVNLVQACEAPGGSTLLGPPGPLAQGVASTLESPVKLVQANGVPSPRQAAECDLHLPLPRTGEHFFWVCTESLKYLQRAEATAGKVYAGREARSQAGKTLTAPHLLSGSLPCSLEADHAMLSL